MCLLSDRIWVFISPKMAFFIVTAVKTSNLTTSTTLACTNLVRILINREIITLYYLSNAEATDVCC
jgi:hypothetical protein